MDKWLRKIISLSLISSRLLDTKYTTAAGIHLWWVELRGIMAAEL